MPSPTPAVIEILDADAVDPARGLPQEIEVQFNPETYRLNKGAQIAEIGVYGIDSPILQFVRGQNETLTLDLFFDSTEDGMDESARDVREQTRSIYQLVKIQPKTHAPPRIRFRWGAGISFKAIVERVEQSFELFAPTGVPLRATLSVTFREYKTLEEQLQELKLESTDHTRRLEVRPGDTLRLIAHRQYGEARLWRLIANENGIRDPLRVAPGTVLRLPPLTPEILAEARAR
ncbi:MAG TPA: LysM peptidoglycan-binding domain-containing protein [Kiloniellaceae bacterium]